MSGADRVLVTGAEGCLGVWVIHELIKEGTPAVAFDISDHHQRLRLLLSEDQLSEVAFRQGDIRDLEAIESLVQAEGITHIVHLAALQIPFCAADPVLGAQVNVTGTVNILEAARRSDGKVRGVAYASSVAVFGPAAMYEQGIAADDSPLAPATLYGVYKQANEGTARVYARDWGLGSVGLRPCIVYGPGRDQGLTSDPTKAMLAAAAGRPGRIGFGGTSTFQHAQDTAACFLAAARVETDQSHVHNLGGPTLSISQIAALIDQAAEAAQTAYEDKELDLPRKIDGRGLDTLIDIKYRTVAQGIADTMEDFRRLLAAGLVAPPG